jgi:hypothetical protein
VDAGFVHGRHQHGGAVVVVQRVVRGVRRVKAVADHRGLMADHVDVGQEVGQQCRVADVADDHSAVCRLWTVRLGQQVVQQDCPVVAFVEHVGDVGTDEAGRAGDQDSHAFDARGPGAAVRGLRSSRHRIVRSCGRTLYVS